MPRNPNKAGGGAQTNINGLHFEQTTSLYESLINSGFEIRNNYKVFCDNYLVGYSINKTAFSTVFLLSRGIEYSDYNSKQ